MQRFILLGLLGLGAGLAYLLDTKRVIVVPKERDKPVPLPPAEPTEEEMRKVMRHLGKKSGLSRKVKR